MCWEEDTSFSTRGWPSSCIHCCTGTTCMSAIAASPAGFFCVSDSSSLILVRRDSKKDDIEAVLSRVPGGPPAGNSSEGRATTASSTGSVMDSACSKVDMQWKTCRQAPCSRWPFVWATRNTSRKALMRKGCTEVKTRSGMRENPVALTRHSVDRSHSISSERTPDSVIKAQHILTPAFQGRGVAVGLLSMSSSTFSRESPAASSIGCTSSESLEEYHSTALSAVLFPRRDSSSR
mmetsp:Transcript_32511/g.91037  ORF Transcript_32511/g.91037 Transcript_32511/m.91037 type:complete len:235 (-) Transcript_32511:1419-2123(-)